MQSKVLFAIILLFNQRSTSALTKTTFTEITEFVAVIIWPLAVVAIMMLFRKNISNVIGRVGSIEASTTGFSLNFKDNMEQLLSENLQGLPSISKSSIQVSTQSPIDQLKTIRTNLKTDLKLLARENGIDSSEFTLAEIGDQLCHKGKFTRQKLKAFLALYELTNSEDPLISQSQVDSVKLIVKDLGF